MKAESIKLELIEWLAKLTDESLLNSLHHLKKVSENVDWAESMSSEQKESIIRGLKDLEDNKVISSETFWEGHGR